MFMPMKPAITPAGSSRTETTVRIFITSFVRWAVRDMWMSNVPMSASRAASIASTAPSNRSVTPTKRCPSRASVTTSKSAPAMATMTARWATRARRVAAIRWRSVTRSARRSPPRVDSSASPSSSSTRARMASVRSR